MNTKMTGFRWLSKTFASCALDESSLSIGRVKESNKHNPFIPIVPKNPLTILVIYFLSEHF